MVDVRDISLLTGLKVLIVEDEALIAMMIEQMLHEVGCTVIGPAQSLSQANALLETNAVAAAVLDVNLNGIFVYPLAHELMLRNIPFIFVTGYARIPPGGQIAIGGDVANIPTLTKPFRRCDLVEALLHMNVQQVSSF